LERLPSYQILVPITSKKCQGNLPYRAGCSGRAIFAEKSTTYDVMSTGARSIHRVGYIHEILSNERFDTETFTPELIFFNSPPYNIVPDGV